MTIAEQAMLVSGLVIAMGFAGLYFLGRMRLHEENRVIMRKAARRADVVTPAERLEHHPQRVRR